MDNHNSGVYKNCKYQEEMKCPDLGRLSGNYQFWQINKIIIKYNRI